MRRPSVEQRLKYTFWYSFKSNAVYTSVFVSQSCING